MRLICLQGAAKTSDGASGRTSWISVLRNTSRSKPTKAAVPESRKTIGIRTCLVLGLSVVSRTPDNPRSNATPSAFDCGTARARGSGTCRPVCNCRQRSPTLDLRDRPPSIRDKCGHHRNTPGLCTLQRTRLKSNYATNTSGTVSAHWYHKSTHSFRHTNNSQPSRTCR